VNKAALIIERKRIADLTPAPYNPRNISSEALSGLQASVDRFGLVKPVVWNRRSGHVVGGHQRLMSLHQIGETELQVAVANLGRADMEALVSRRIAKGA